MKKVLMLVFAMVFVISAGVFADVGKGMDMGKDMDGCGMMMMKADMKVENTSDGVKIICTSKDSKEVGEIQENAAKMVEMHGKMKSGKEEGVKGKDGMWGRGMGMGMGNPMMEHMQKKMGIIFGFLICMWSLIIILIACTIVLVIKKIMAK